MKNLDLCIIKNNYNQYVCFYKDLRNGYGDYIETSIGAFLFLNRKHLKINFSFNEKSQKGHLNCFIYSKVDSKVVQISNRKNAIFCGSSTTILGAISNVFISNRETLRMRFSILKFNESFSSSTVYGEGRDINALGLNERKLYRKFKFSSQK